MSKFDGAGTATNIKGRNYRNMESGQHQYIYYRNCDLQIYTIIRTCSPTVSLNITIVGTISPTFPTIANSYCQNATAPALPPTSIEGITGTWSPASINTSAIGTSTYKFTPTTVGTCSIPVSLNITIVSNITPTFPPLANSYCQNAAAPALPLTSNEGITGTWSPASINTSVPGTSTYKFTPSPGTCSIPVSLSITIVGNITPTFPTIANSYCQNTTAPALPPMSKEGISRNMESGQHQYICPWNFDLHIYTNCGYLFKSGFFKHHNR